MDDDNLITFELISYKNKNIKEVINYFKFWLDTEFIETYYESNELQTEHFFSSKNFKIDYYKFILKIENFKLDRLIKKSIFE